MENLTKHAEKSLKKVRDAIGKSDDPEEIGDLEALETQGTWLVMASVGDTEKARKILLDHTQSEDWCRTMLSDYSSLFVELEDSMQYAGFGGHDELFIRKTDAEQACASKVGKDGVCPKI